MPDLHILVVLASTREGRYGDKPAFWIRDHLAQDPQLEVELVDLRTLALPLYAAARLPSQVKDGAYGDPIVDGWATQVAAADGFVLVTPEYNHGYPAPLKNALDWLYVEWRRKPVAFVGYGGVGAARSIEQLRQVSIELQMAPLRSAVHLPREIVRATASLDPTAAAPHFAPIAGPADALRDELVWWARALQQARQPAVATGA